jgi:hypothetical protein
MLRLGMHSNVMLRFTVQALQDPPLLSSTRFIDTVLTHVSILYHWKKSTWVSKNAEFDADFEFVDKFAKKSLKKVIVRKPLRIIIKE